MKTSKYPHSSIQKLSFNRKLAGTPKVEKFEG